MYETFSILSGIVLLIGALVLPGSAGHRLAWIAGGVFFIGYGIYVAQATSGYFVFPVFIFIIPFVGVFLIGRAAFGTLSRPTGKAPSVLPYTPSAPQPSAETGPRRLEFPSKGASAHVRAGLEAAMVSLAYGRSRTALEQVQGVFEQAVEADDAAALALVVTSAEHIAQATELATPRRAIEARDLAAAATRCLGALTGRAQNPISAASSLDAEPQPVAAPAPGWYEDPIREADLRWWDGAAWSAEVRSS